MVLRYDSVTVTYPGADRPALRDVDLEVDEGELLLVVGETGSGKSTLLRAANGLVPHFSGGELRGQVLVAGRDTAVTRPRDLADVVGIVGQEPAAGFVCDTVEEELAYVMENLAMAPAVMRRRVEEALDLLGIDGLRHARVGELSGGEQQRVAIASVLTASPRLLVLDEPTSALDPAGADDVLAAVGRLVHDVGLTVVMSEHRLERVIHLADRVALVEDAAVRVGTPEEIMATSPVAPPVIELGRLAGWSPLPTSIRTARRSARPLVAELARGVVAGWEDPAIEASHPAEGPASFEAHGMSAAYGSREVLRRIDLRCARGEVTALMGRNGSGKSTLLSLVAGVTAPSGGRVAVGERDPAELTGAERVRVVGYVPQDAGILLGERSVRDELAASDRDSGLAAGTTAARLASLSPAPLAPDTHPRDLSSGQRLLLVLAIVLAPDPGVLLLDEPTRGLDYGAKALLRSAVRNLAETGASVLVATHDVEFAATVADRVVVLSHGEVIADDDARDVLCHSTVFAPQVAKVLSPLPFLTVDEVVTANIFRADKGTFGSVDLP